MTEVKKEGVLSLVLPENTKVSGKSINIEETVSHRSLEKGTMDSYVGTDWYQKVLFYQYLVNYLGNYVEKKQDRVLEYELEYVLGGKRNGADNLKILVFGGLLAMKKHKIFMASLTTCSSDNQRQWHLRSRWREYPHEAGGIESVTRNKTRATVRLQKADDVSGYILQYSTSEKFSKKSTKSKTVKGTTVKLSGLNKNKIYYLRVKRYKKYNGKTYYSDYGNTYTVWP